MPGAWSWSATIVVGLAVSLSACAKTETTGTEPKSSKQGALATVKVGELFPAYKAARLEGGSYDVGNQRGKVVLLNLWATWCAPCRAEIPELNEIHRVHEGKGFEVVGVSIDAEDQKEEVRTFVTQNIRYPVVLDPEARLQELLETTAIPTSALIDREGRVTWIGVGALERSDPELLEAIRKAL